MSGHYDNVRPLVYRHPRPARRYGSLAKVIPLYPQLPMARSWRTAGPFLAALAVLVAIAATLLGVSRSASDVASRIFTGFRWW